MKTQRKTKGKSGMIWSRPQCGLLNASFMVILFLLGDFQANSQSKWNNHVGVYFTGDAEMYYIGPSILLSSDFLITKDLGVGFYGHHFKRDYGNRGFQALTVAALGQVYIGKRKKFYVAIGIAWQRAIENHDFSTDLIDRSIFLPAYRIGRHFVFKKFVLSPEIVTTGPYTYSGGMSRDIFTLPSIGTRLQLISSRN